MHTHVVHTANAVCVRCAYRLVSVRCVLLQFVAMPIGVSCSPFRFDAVRFSSSSRTFNPTSFAGILCHGTEREQGWVYRLRRPLLRLLAFLLRFRSPARISIPRDREAGAAARIPRSARGASQPAQQRCRSGTGTTARSVGQTSSTSASREKGRLFAVPPRRSLLGRQDERRAYGWQTARIGRRRQRVRVRVDRD